MSERKSFKTQVGLEFNDSNQNFVIGDVRDLSSKPINKDKNKRVNTAVFNMAEQGEPSNNAGDPVVYELEVEGGLCGFEALLFDAVNNGDEAAKTLVESYPNITDIWQYADVASCTEVFIPTGPGEPPQNREDLCLTASEGSAPQFIGEIKIYNLGSDLDQVGFDCPERDANSCFKRHGEYGWKTSMGDVLFAGIGRPLPLTDEEQIEYRYTKNSSYRELLCDCNGLPGWLESIQPTFAPCEPQGQNTESNPSNPPIWEIRGRTFLCTDWAGLNGGRPIQPGALQSFTLGCSDPFQSPCATGVSIKLICGPGEYTKLANSGKRFKPAGAPDSANLWRYIRKPKVKVKIEVIPKII